MDIFEIGDKVVYPNHGVGIIEKISNRLIQGKFERFYLLRICSNDILVMVLTANAGDVGLRKIIERRDVEQLLSFLSSNQFFTQKDWKDRFKENSEKVRAGSIFHSAARLRTRRCSLVRSLYSLVMRSPLALLSLGWSISFGSRIVSKKPSRRRAAKFL